MARKTVQPIDIKLDIKGGEQLGKLSSAFRDLGKTVGQTDAGLEEARKSIIEYGKTANQSEALIRGQIKAFEGLQKQAELGGKVFTQLENDIKALGGVLYGASAAVEAKRKSLTDLGSSANATTTQIQSAIKALTVLRSETRLDSEAFNAFGQSIDRLAEKFEKAKQEAQDFANAQARSGRLIGATSGAAKQQINDLTIVTEALREQREELGRLEGEARIRRGVADLAERGAVSSSRRSYQEALAESVLSGTAEEVAGTGASLKKLLSTKDIRAALAEVELQIAEFQKQIESKLSRGLQISFQETSRAARESARAMAAAFADPELLGILDRLDQRIGELPNTTAGLNQRLRELQQQLANTARDSDAYVSVSLEIARVQREAAAATQGLGAALVRDLNTGVAARSSKNLREAIGQLQSEMNELDVQTAEGSILYAENANQVRNLETELRQLGDSYRYVSDMAEQAAAAQGTYANTATARNYLNRAMVRAQEAAGAQVAEAVRAGVAATPLMLPAAGGTTAPGTGLQISGRARVGRDLSGIQRFFSRAEIGEAQIQVPGQPVGYGPQPTEAQADRSRRAAISEANAIRESTEAKKAARNAELSLRREIREAKGAYDGSINSINRLKSALENYRVTLPATSKRFQLLTRDLVELDRKSEAVSRRMGRRRGMSSMQMTQAAGAAISGGIFGGPEGFLGGAIGAIGGVGGAFAGAAIGAQVGGLRRQLGEFADYAAGIQRLQIALEGVAGGQAAFNSAIASARDVVERLNVPQETAIQGMTRLTAAVKGAGGGIPEASAAFKNVTAAIIATGGGAEQVEGAITALVQIFSKGKVSMEEINQIAERLPGAFNIFADAAGKTGPELLKGLQKGEIGLNDLMSFVQELGVRFEDTANIIGNSSQSAGARLRVAFNDMQIAVGEALQPLGAEIQSVFADLLEDSIPALIELANTTVSAMRAVGTVLMSIINNLDLVVGSFAALGSALAIGRVVAYAKQIGDLTTIIGLARRETVQLIKSTATFAKMRGALTLLLNPWAALAAGIVAAGVGLYRAATANDRFNKSIRAGKVDLTEASEELQKMYERVNLLGVRLEGESNNRLLQSLRRQMLRARKDAERTAEAIETLIYKPYGKDFVGPVMQGMSPADEAKNAFDAQKRQQEEEARKREQRAQSLLNAIEQRENAIAQARIQLEEQAANIRKQAIEQARQLEEQFANQRLQKERQLQDIRRQLAYVEEDIAFGAEEARAVAAGADPEVFAARRQIIEFSRQQKEEEIALDRQLLDEQAENTQALEEFKINNAKAINEANEAYAKQIGRIQQEYARSVAKIIEQGTGRAGERLELAGIIIANQITQAEAQATALQLGYSFKRGGGVAGDPDYGSVLTKFQQNALAAARQAFVNAEQAIDRAYNSLADIPTATAIAAPAITSIGNVTADLDSKAIALAKSLDAARAQIRGISKDLSDEEFLKNVSSAFRETGAEVFAQQRSLASQQSQQRRILRLREEGFSGEVASQLVKQEDLVASRLRILKAQFEEAKKERPQSEEGLAKDFEKTKENIEASSNAIREFTVALSNIPTEIKLRTAVVDAKQQLRDLVDTGSQVQGAATAIGDAFSQSFADAISGSKTAKEALADFFQSVGSYFLDMAKQIIAKMIQIAILNSVAKVLPSTNFTTSSGVGLSAGAATQSGFSMGSSLASMFANGGIMTEKGPLELNRYASGGIARGPQLAMFGEGRMPEAYVPLPDGRSIPVTMEGGKTSTNVVVNVDASGTSVQGDDRRGKELGNAISAAVQAELIKQQRPGGLLNR